MLKILIQQPLNLGTRFVLKTRILLRYMLVYLQWPQIPHLFIAADNGSERWLRVAKIVVQHGLRYPVDVGLAIDAEIHLRLPQWPDIWCVVVELGPSPLHVDVLKAASHLVEPASGHVETVAVCVEPRDQLCLTLLFED